VTCGAINVRDEGYQGSDEAIEQGDGQLGGRVEGGVARFYSRMLNVSG